MPGLPPDLYKRLCAALIDSGYCDSADALRAVCVDERLTPWRNRLPDARDPQSRAEAVVDKLWDQHTEDGENALVLLLHALSERFDPVDARHTTLGDARRAIEFYEQALEIEKEIGDRRAEGSILGNLGNAYADLGDARRAIEFYEQRLVIAREIGDRRGEGNALWNMTLALDSLGEQERAIPCAQAALAIREQIEDPNIDKVRRWLAALP